MLDPNETILRATRRERSLNSNILQASIPEMGEEMLPMWAHLFRGADGERREQPGEREALKSRKISQLLRFG